MRFGIEIGLSSWAAASAAFKFAILKDGGCILSSVIRICTSHRTEVLLDAFAANLTEERKRHGPFSPVKVVVPNRNVETYLRLKVCEHCGIAANLETTFLRRFLSSIANAAVPGARVADAAHVEAALLALLHDEALLAQPDLAEVRRYLGAAEGDADALDRRRCQLAAELAALFEEYAGSRSDMLSSWAAGTPDDLHHPAAVWQRALWRAVFGPAGRLASSETAKYQSLESLWSVAMQCKPAPLAGQAVHVFGLSYVATAYHRMLGELGQQAEVLVYTLSPCQEAGHADRVAGASSQEDPFGLADEANLALRLWGRPGRENLRLLAALPGAVVDGRFPKEEPAPPTLLRRLQDWIVQRGAETPVRDGETLDESLRVIPCPSLRRELEVVAAEIWSRVRKDPSLRLSDIAVIVPEASKDLYLTQLSAVFGESCELPHNVADLPATAGHRALQAIEHLIDLPFSSLSRKEVLPLLTHPCLMARFPEATPEMWRALADQLGIIRGADRDDFDAAYLARDVFSWDQGLRRLTLGAFADGASPDGAAPLSVGGECYLPGPPIASDDQARLGFGLLARSLLADVRFAVGRDVPPRRPLGQWLQFLRGMVEGYLVLDEDDGAGQGAVAEFLRRLDDLGDLGLDEQLISYRVAAELARRELGALPWSRGRYLSTGVTVASFVPMRAIPFRMVFVLGLGQGAFPRPAGRSELDLRQGGRRAGDVDRHEQDLYMFLETLLSARDGVVLSYVARDEVTGEELPASSVLLELRSVLGQRLVGADDLDRLFSKTRASRPPLRRHDDSAERRQVLPVAEAEHRARALGQLVRPHPFDPTPVAESVASLPEGARAALAKALGMPAPPEAAGLDLAKPLSIPLSVLRRFLEDPLQGSARFRLGLREDDDDDLADVEDEPFDLANRDRTRLLGASMTAALQGAQAVPGWDAVDKSYRQTVLAAELAGRCPTGLFREAEFRRHEETLMRWQRELAGFLGEAPLPIAPVRLGPHASADGSEGSVRLAVRPSPRMGVVIAGGTVEVCLTGQTGLCARKADATGISLAFTCRGKIDALRFGKEELRAFLDYVALTAAGEEPRRDGHRSILAFRSDDDLGVRICDFAPLARARATEYLTNLCRELLAPKAGVHPYLLPHEAVLASHEHGTGVVDEIRALCADSERNGMSSLRGPVPDVLARYAPPSSAEAERMAQARFGLFFDLILEAKA
jgi:exodeoxyribonuclease V gamma subunit